MQVNDSFNACNAIWDIFILIIKQAKLKLVDFLLANILHCVTYDVVEHLYNRKEVLDFVLAASGEENSDIDDELIADVEDKSGEVI